MAKVNTAKSSPCRNLIAFQSFETNFTSFFVFDTFNAAPAYGVGYGKGYGKLKCNKILHYFFK